MVLKGGLNIDWSW